MTTRPTVMLPAGTNQDILLDTYNVQVLDEARWQQEVLRGIHATDKVAGLGVDTLPMGGRNLLMDTNFQLALAVLPATIAAGAESMPIFGWFASNVAGLNWEAGDPGIAELQLTGTFGANGYVRQVVLGAQEFAGRTVTFTALGKAPANYPWYVSLSDSTGRGVIPPEGFRIGTGGWRRSTCSLLVAPGATYLVAYVVSALAMPSAFKIAAPMLTVTSGTPGYIPLQRGYNQRFIDSHRITLPFACRFRSLAAGHAERFTLNFPPLGLAPSTYSAGLYSGVTGTYYDPSVVDNNIDIDATKTLVTDYSDRHVGIQVTAVFGASDTYVEKGWVTLDTAT